MYMYLFIDKVITNKLIIKYIDTKNISICINNFWIYMVGEVLRLPLSMFIGDIGKVKYDL